LEFPEGLAPHMISPSLAKKLYKAGLSIICLPLESSDNEIVKNRFHKASNNVHIKNSIKYLLDAGYFNRNIWIFVMVGLPNQSLESQLDSLWFVWENKVRPTFMFFTPIPGTEEYEKYKPLISGKEMGDLHPYIFPFADSKFFSVNDMEDLLSLHISRHPLQRLDYLQKNSKVRSYILKKLSEDIDMRRFSYQLMLYENFMSYEFDFFNKILGETGPTKTIISFYMENFEKFSEDYQQKEKIENEKIIHNNFKNLITENNIKIASRNDPIKPIDKIPNLIDLFSFLYTGISEIKNMLNDNTIENLVIRVWSKDAITKYPNFFPHGLADDSRNAIPVCKDTGWWHELFKKLDYSIGGVTAGLVFTIFQIKKEKTITNSNDLKGSQSDNVVILN
jgi:hypothetical protein